MQRKDHWTGSMSKLIFIFLLIAGEFLTEQGCFGDTAHSVAAKSNMLKVSLSQQMRTAFKVPIANASLDKKQLHSPSNQPAVESAADNVGSSGSVDPAILSPTDMPSDMLTFATEIAIKAFTSFTSVADMAEYLRMKFEARFPSMATGNWQTSVGSNFASSIRKRTGTGFYAKLKNTYFLIYASP